MADTSRSSPVPLLGASGFFSIEWTVILHMRSALRSGAGMGAREAWPGRWCGDLDQDQTRGVVKAAEHGGMARIRAGDEASPGGPASSAAVPASLAPCAVCRKTIARERDGALQRPGAGGGTRTRTAFRPRHFKCLPSAIPARPRRAPACGGRRRSAATGCPVSRVRDSLARARHGRRPVQPGRAASRRLILLAGPRRFSAARRRARSGRGRTERRPPAPARRSARHRRSAPRPGCRCRSPRRSSPGWRRR
jgi:hypothetical protein